MQKFHEMTFMEVCRLPGVADIKPIQAKAAFGKALMRESAGEHIDAEELLAKAAHLVG